MVARRDDPNDVTQPVEIFAREPLERARRDLKQAAATLSLTEIRFLVDSYYEVQAYRIQAANQVRALVDGEEPMSLLEWTSAAFARIEDEIRKGLDVYSMQESTGVGAWMRCAPPGSRVRIDSGRWSKRREVPIEELQDGSLVTSFHRKKASLTRPYPIEVGSRTYSGDLISVTTDGCQTETTPNHLWPVRLLKTDEGFSVYLMTDGTRWRVGRCRLFTRRGGDYLRLGVQARARGEHAAVWLLGTFSTEREAAVYESYISVAYGLTERVFRPMLTGHVPFFDDDMTTALFAMLDAKQQRERGEQCLRDHNLLPEYPIWSWTGGTSTQSPTGGLVTAAANIQPEFMAVGVPPSSYGAMEWQKIVSAHRRHYDGPVYSLDIAPYHTYIQDGLITHNSIVGIGPVIASGFLAHIDIERAPTVGHIWSFAGLNPTAVWEKGQKRPWNARLKVLCWKAGASFVKVSNNPRDIYGKLYQTRKLYEQTRNEAGELADQAAAILTKKRIGKDTDAYKAYSIGKLPPAHIQARAERWAVKAFLSDLHHVLYEQKYGKLPPFPYPTEHLGHAHVRGVPNHVCIGE